MLLGGRAMHIPRHADFNSIFIVSFTIYTRVAANGKCVKKNPFSESRVGSRVYLAGPGINPRHVDAILVKIGWEFFSENLGIDSTRDRYMEY